MRTILLQKSFWGADRSFSGPLMRLAHGDMRDHVVWYKNGYGASYRRCGVLRWRSRLKSAFAGFSALFDFRLLQQNPHQSGHPPAARAYGFTPWFQSVSREETRQNVTLSFSFRQARSGGIKRAMVGYARFAETSWSLGGRRQL